jgi:hypothetical protein
MSDLERLLWVAAGVAVSVLLPLLRAILPKPPKNASMTWWSAFWITIRPYIITAIFSIVVAALILVFIGDTITSWKGALAAGYAFDSTLQKISTGNTATELRGWE